MMQPGYERTNLENLKAHALRLAARIDALIEVGGREWEHPRQRGDVKRASMDVTRACADYRQGREVVP